MGSTFNPENDCSAGQTFFQVLSPSGEYAAPVAGVITSWSFQAAASPPGPVPPTLKLKVARIAGGTPLVVGESDARTPIQGTLSTFPTRISVEAGDVLGLAILADGYCGEAGTGGYVTVRSAGDPPPGATAPVSAAAAARLDVSATLEPDCDGDGFGDETQDDNLNPCPPGPNATFTETPKDKVKTKKKRKNVTFAFNANEPGATFNCVLDGKQEFKTCTSPLTVKVKKGKHTLSVTASDAGGNAGTPATDSFKVKRKKQK